MAADMASADVGQGAVPMIELWRGGRLESLHHGHAAVCAADGSVIEAWGNPAAVVYPRSSCKMIQALPLLESGAGSGLSQERLALACASHQGAAGHVGLAARWLAELGLGEADLRCGVHEPRDRAELERLIRACEAPSQLHNNCSGKHAGFLMLCRHLDAGPEYVEIDHPVQRAVRDAFEEVTGAESPGWGIDGCSAPNFACTLQGLAAAMARFAAASDAGDARARAMVRLREAMARRPELVAGEGRACTELMRAMDGVAIKTGAEAVFVAILPGTRRGLALKVADGGTRAAEAAVVALLAREGVLDARHPAALKRLGAPLLNWRGLAVGETRLAPGFPGGRRP